MTSRILSIYDLLSGYCGAIKRRAKRRVVDLTADELDDAARRAFYKAAKANKPLPIYPTSRSIAIRVTINEREVLEDYVWVLSREQLDNLSAVDVIDLKTEIRNKFGVALTRAVQQIRQS